MAYINIQYEKMRNFSNHVFSKFGFTDEGVSEKSTHGNAVWYQMRLTF